LAGTEAERIFYPDAPALPADHDVQEAAAFAGVICSSPEAVAAFLEFAWIEAQAIVRDHQHIVIALANALKVRRSLDAEEIDLLIAAAVEANLIEDEKKRRLDWRRPCESAAGFQQ
jgi:hypothetical protein